MKIQHKNCLLDLLQKYKKIIDGTFAPYAEIGALAFNNSHFSLLLFRGCLSRFVGG